jgi:hypothetical protein
MDENNHSHQNIAIIIRLVAEKLIVATHHDLRIAKAGVMVAYMWLENYRWQYATNSYLTTRASNWLNMLWAAAHGRGQVYCWHSLGRIWEHNMRARAFTTTWTRVAEPIKDDGSSGVDRGAGERGAPKALRELVCVAY